MTSHDWARQLQKDAEFLLSKAEVEIGSIPLTSIFLYGQKEKFLNLVRAAIPGKKEVNEFHVNFLPTGSNLVLTINRDAVCRKVQDVKYECEPLLSPEEDAEMEAAAHG